MRRRLARTLTLSCVLASALAVGLMNTGGAARASLQEERPAVTNRVKPVYPAVARFARIAGAVNVEVEIDAEGRVTGAKAGEGHPLLGEAARKAAERWTFERASGGSAVRTARLTFEFRSEVERPEGGDEDEDAKQASPYHVVVRFVKVTTVSVVSPGEDGRTCRVHGFKLERSKVRIQYGLAISDGDFDEAARELFPNANTEWGGGCVVTEDSPEFAEVLFCEACRAAKSEWLLAHRAPRAGAD